MQPYNGPRVRSRSVHFVGLPIAFAIISSGCAGPRPPITVEADITHATSLHSDLVFRADEMPLDEPDSIVESLTIVEATRLALTTDPELQAALARVRIAMAEADQARLFPNPILNAVVRVGSGKPQIELSLAQDFVSVLQAKRRASAADHRLRQAAADAMTTALDVLANVQQEYQTARALEAVGPVLEDQRGLVERLAGIARARLDAGEGTRTDLITLQTEQLGLEIQAAERRRQLASSRLRLARLIGQPQSRANWPLESWADPTSEAASEDRWIHTGLANRPEVQSMVWKLAALGDEQALAAWFAWEGGSAGVDATRDDAWFAGPSISTPVPILDTGQARQAKVTAEQIEARHHMTLAKRKVVEEIRIALNGMAAAQANLTRVERELQPLQEQRRDQAQRAFEAGHADVTELLLAQR